MSEEGQGSDPRGAYPPPPPPGTFPDQQPYAPQASYPPQQPAKKRRGLVIGIVVAVLLLCAIGGCMSLLGLGLFMNGADTETIGKAEESFSAATSAVETASASLKTAEPGSPKTAQAIADADKSLRVARDGIAAAKATISQLDESQGRADYIASLDAATEALDGLQDMVAYLDSATGMAGKIAEGASASRRAMGELNTAITAGNRNDYSTMKTRASAAQSGFTKAAVLFRDAHKIDPSAGLDKAAGYAEKRRKQAELVIRMAESGRAKRLTAYNRDIDSMEAFGREADEIGEPEIVAAGWADKRLAELEKRITAAGEKSDTLRAKALEELGVTD